MDISKELPNPLPGHWPKLDGKMRELLQVYPLQDIVGMGYVLNREYADRTLVSTLRTLLSSYNCIKSFHVYYACGEDGCGCFHVYPEILPMEVHEKHVTEACRLAVYRWEEDHLNSTGDKLEFLYLREAFQRFAERYGLRTVVVERNTA